MTISSDQVFAAIKLYADELRESGDEARRCAIAMAKTDDAHAKAHSVAYALSTGTSNAARNAEAASVTLDERHKMKLAEGLWKSAIEAQRSNRAIVSAYQSYVSFAKTEAELAR